MERTIGNLGQEIRLHSNPFSNLMQRGVAWATTNCLIAQYPQLFTPSIHVPHGTINLGNGYSLLQRPTSRLPEPIELPEQQAYARYARTNLLNPMQVTTLIRRGRVLLPNGHFVRSAWKEDQNPKGRTSRMVKVYLSA